MLVVYTDDREWAVSTIQVGDSRVPSQGWCSRWLVRHSTDYLWAWRCCRQRCNYCWWKGWQLLSHFWLFIHFAPEIIVLLAIHESASSQFLYMTFVRSFWRFLLYDRCALSFSKKRLRNYLIYLLELHLSLQWFCTIALQCTAHYLIYITVALTTSFITAGFCLTKLHPQSYSSSCLFQK